MRTLKVIQAAKACNSTYEIESNLIISFLNDMDTLPLVRRIYIDFFSDHTIRYIVSLIQDILESEDFFTKDIFTKDVLVSRIKEERKHAPESSLVDYDLIFSLYFKSNLSVESIEKVKFRIGELAKKWKEKQRKEFAHFIASMVDSDEDWTEIAKQKLEFINSTANLIIQDSESHNYSDILREIAERIERDVLEFEKSENPVHKGFCLGVPIPTRVYEDGMSKIKYKSIETEAGRLYGISGKSHHGKTTGLIHMAANSLMTAKLEGKECRAVYFTVEETKEQITNRFYSSFNIQNITQQQTDYYLKEGHSYKVGSHTLKRNLKNGVNSIDNLYIEELHQASDHLYFIESKIVQIKPDIIFLDYYQLLTISSIRRKGLRTDEVLDFIGRELKRMAIQYKIPIVIAVQMLNKTENVFAPPKSDEILNAGSIMNNLDSLIMVQQFDPLYVIKDKRGKDIEHPFKHHFKEEDWLDLENYAREKSERVMLKYPFIYIAIAKHRQEEGLGFETALKPYNAFNKFIPFFDSQKEVVYSVKERNKGFFMANEKRRNEIFLMEEYYNF